MIFEDIIRQALSCDPLEEAKAKVQTRRVGAIIKERYEEMHGGALRRLRSSVPTEGQSPSCSRRVSA